MVKGGRERQQEIRGDRLGWEDPKNDLKKWLTCPLFSFLVPHSHRPLPFQCSHALERHTRELCRGCDNRNIDNRLFRLSPPWYHELKEWFWRPSASPSSDDDAATSTLTLWVMRRRRLGAAGGRRWQEEGKNAVRRREGGKTAIEVNFYFWNNSGYKIGRQNLARGCIQKPQTNAPSRGICAKLPGREGKMKTIWPLWCNCSSPFLVIERLLAEP